MHLELAITLRYLAALSLLAPSYAFARAIQRELAEGNEPIHEFIEPIHRTPLHQLSPDEQLWKRTAERITTQ